MCLFVPVHGFLVLPYALVMHESVDMASYPEGKNHVPIFTWSTQLDVCLFMCMMWEARMILAILWDSSLYSK